MMKLTQQGSVVIESKKRSVVNSNTRIDIDLRLSKIPVELHPAVNRIAFELASGFGWECSADFDFLNSDDTRIISFARLALVAMVGLQDYCMDEWGTSLDSLVDEQ
ncbi:MAG: hypothetical protein ACRC2V_18840 [Xenococcaceae cyanobacterium]